MSLLERQFGSSKKDSYNEEETYLLSTLILYIIGSSDGSFSENEKEVLTEYIKSLPENKVANIKKTFNTTDINYDNVISKCKSLKDDDKLKLLNYSVNMVVADGLVLENEVIILKEICEMIDADFSGVIEVMKNNFKIDIENIPSSYNKTSNVNIEPVLGFRSHHKLSANDVDKIESKFCTSCGQENNLVSKFCLLCGLEFKH